MQADVPIYAGGGICRHSLCSWPAVPLLFSSTSLHRDMDRPICSTFRPITPAPSRFSMRLRWLPALSLPICYISLPSAWVQHLCTSFSICWKSISPQMRKAETHMQFPIIQKKGLMPASTRPFLFSRLLDFIPRFSPRCHPPANHDITDNVSREGNDPADRIRKIKRGHCPVHCKYRKNPYHTEQAGAGQ